MNQVLRVITTSNLGTHYKGNPITRITSQYKKYTDLNGFTTRNHSISTTRKIVQGLIQRYKASYSQMGVTQIHLGRKRLVVRRYGWSRTSQILFLHLLFSLICFATKTMPSLQKPSWGRQPQFPHEKASDTASTSSPPRQPGWLRCEEQRQRPERKQVFVLLANTFLAPTKTKRVLSLGG